MPRLAMLNSCQSAAGVAQDVFSSAGASLVRQIPAVVAMQFSISDGAAQTFAASFYQALAHNRGVDEAVRIGRIALSGWHADTLEWITPVLYMRSRETRLITLTSSATSTDSSRSAPVSEQRSLRTAQTRGTPAPLPAPAAQAPHHTATPTRVIAGPGTWTALSADCTLLAVTESRRLRLWSVQDGQCTLLWQHQKRLGGILGSVTDAQFSQDGTRLAVAHTEGADIWNAATGQKIVHVRDQDIVHGMAFSPDGTRLATESKWGLEIWDGATGVCLRKEMGSGRPRAYSPDGSRLAVFGYDKRWLEDADTGRHPLLLDIDKGIFLAAAFSPDGSRIAMVGERVEICDTATGQMSLRIEKIPPIFPEPDVSVYYVAFSPDGTRIATSQGRNTAVWDTATGQLRFVAHHTNLQKRQIVPVKFTPDGTSLITGAGLAVWELGG
jgi:WD40 repeat protein